MSVFGRIVKLTQKSTLLWHAGEYHKLNFKSKHKIGDIIDINDNLLTECETVYNHSKDEILFKLFKSRFEYLEKIRIFFKDMDFLEVSTPKLKDSIIDETNISIMKTGYGYLTPSPEVEIKKLLSLGFDKLFELCYAYRDDYKDKLHKKEFLILEWYRALSKPKEIIDDLMNLIKYLNSNSLLYYSGSKINLNIIDYAEYNELFLRYADIDINDVDIEALKDEFNLEGNLKKQDVFDYVFALKIEKKLGFNNPIVVYNFPKNAAALSKIKNNNAQRFETYIAGIELANCYEEETDYKEIEKRFKNTDKLFFEAMKKGIPPTSGIAVGVDRLIMLLENLDSIIYLNI